MHSIRAKITAVTIAAILTSILAFFALGYLTLYPDNEQRTTEMMNLLSENTKQSLEEYSNSIEQSVEIAANIARDNLDGAVLVEYGAAGLFAEENGRTAEQTEKLDNYLTEHLISVQKSFSGINNYTRGVLSYYYTISPDISQNVHGFFWSKAGKTGFEEQIPINAQELNPDDLEHNIWYYSTIERGRPSWTGPYRDYYINDELIMSYTVPVYKAGTLIGIMGMDIPYKVIIEQVAPIRLYQTGYACLLASDGTVIYHPELPIGALPAYVDAADSEFIIHNKNNGDHLIKYTIDGEKQELAFTSFSNGMKLIVTAPEAEINAAWHNMEKNILAAAVFLFVIFLSILLFITHLITAPLQNLTSASQKLADGNYDTKLNYTGKDEVGTLTLAFSKMRDHMQEYIRELKRRINTDALTGLPNMNYFFKLAEKNRQIMKDSGKEPAFLYFNLIGMKYFNRQFDFLEGDRLIIAVADVLRQEFGEENCSRFGLDQFAVLTEDVDLRSRLEVILQKCRDANDGKSLPVRVGIYPEKIADVSVNIACDRAKYASDMHRTSYESGYYRFDTSMLEHSEIYRHVINNLDRALNEGWVQVYYQPIIRAVSGSVCDEEALSRWVDPEIGFLSPGDFIPILENSKLIYKLDLYVLDEVIKKIKLQIEKGLYVVPQSLNLSRLDFEACDIVGEICQRLDDAGIPRDKLTIEITESIVGEDFDFMKKQILRFQSLGFQVWMDDFGSGYSSLDVLQNIHFDLIKFDMRFMQSFNGNEESRIILTELINMAAGLGIDTLSEGVETQEQADFLREVGCSKLQGYYYSKPLSRDDALSRYKEHTILHLENPKEEEYYHKLGTMNLFNLSVIPDESDAPLSQFFDTMPTALMEIHGNEMRFIRSNQTCRTFMEQVYKIHITSTSADYFPIPDFDGSSLPAMIRQCVNENHQIFFDDIPSDNTTVHTLLRYIGTNPVTGVSAVSYAVLSVTDAGQGPSFSSVARALAADYFNLFYVNLLTDDFIEYSPSQGSQTLDLERRGHHFFQEAVNDSRTILYPPDVKMFTEIFTKENLIHQLDEQGTFSLTYRLNRSEGPVYCNMKAMRMQAEPNYIIIGVSNIDVQMKQKVLLDQANQDKVIHSRLMAIAGDYACIYTVDLSTGNYSEYSSSSDYELFGLAKTGDDFFTDAQRNAESSIMSEDQAVYMQKFSRDNILKTIQETGSFVLHYHLMLKGKPTEVTLRAGIAKESDGDKLIVGVTIDNI